MDFPTSFVQEYTISTFVQLKFYTLFAHTPYMSTENPPNPQPTQKRPIGRIFKNLFIWGFFAAVVAAIEAGVAPSDAVAPYLEDAVFDAWLADLATQLEAAVS